MKKNYCHMFILLLGLSLSNIAPLHGMQTATQEQVSPTLKAIVKKKYIDKKPLSKQEQVYLKKVSKTALIAGLTTLLIVIGASIGAGTKKMVDVLWEARKKKYKDALQRHNVEIDEGNIETVLNIIDVWCSPDYTLEYFKRFILKPQNREIYHQLSQKKDFRSAMSELGRKSIKALPKLEKRREAGYYFP